MRSLLFVLAALPAIAQSPQKFVRIEIAATNRHDQAVSDLRRSEIRLYDNDRAQQMIYWRKASQTPQVAVVVLNLQNTGVGSAAWNEAVQAMRRDEASAYMYFYVLTASGMLPIHSVPQPGAASIPLNRPWMAETLPPFQSSPVLQRTPWKQQFGASPVFGIGIDIAQYAALASRLAQFPGPKSLVCAGCLISNIDLWNKDYAHSDPGEADFALKLRYLAEAFREARVAVYPVDGIAASNRLASEVGELGDSKTAGRIDAFARATGGAAYAHGEIRAALSQALADSRSTYRAAYLPAPENWDGKPHRIRVECARAGVRIRSLGWYFADALEETRSEWKPAIPEYAATSPFEQSEIRLSIADPAAAAGVITLRGQIEGADLLLTPADGHLTGNVVVQALCYSPEGRILACTQPANVAVNLDSGGPDQVPFHLSVPSSQVFSKVRVVAYDPNSGAAGSKTIAVAEARH